jgi:hypothetical protein
LLQIATAKPPPIGRFSHGRRDKRQDFASPRDWRLENFALRDSARKPHRNRDERAVSGTPRLSHLQQLEDESIHIMREVAAQFSKPVMLY